MTALAVAQATASWYVVAGSNDRYWRVGVPAKAIGAKVCAVPITTGKEQFSEPGIARGREFRWYLNDEDDAVYLDHEGAAVFTRPDLVRAVHMLAMRAQGVRVTAEVDDNYLAPTKMNPHLAQHWDNELSIKHVRALACADAIVFSTAWLRDQYLPAIREETDDIPELHVCGNHVDPDDWPEPIASPDGRLRVGFYGGPSHQIDVRLIEPAMRWASEQGHQVKMIGVNPDWSFPYVHVPWIDPLEYERAAVPLDIGLCPLRTDRFGLGKTDVKFLEYTMSGAATIASNMPIYRSVVHEKTGLVAGGPGDFVRQVQRLCRDRRLRVELAAAAAEYVRSERLVGQHVEEWREAVVG